MIEIRPAVPADAHALAEAHTEGWRSGYRGVIDDAYLDAPEFRAQRLATWQAWTWNERGHSACFCAVLDGRTVGFGLCGPARVEPVCDGTEADPVATPIGEVYAFYLHPDAWGSGCAPALMAACEDWLRGQSFTTAVLWVLRDNPRGRAFYEKAGWQPTGKDGTFDGPATAACRTPLPMWSTAARCGDLHRTGAQVGPPNGRYRSVMELIDLVPNSLSFRVFTTINVDDESEIPTGFTGRVRRHVAGSIAYVAWYTEGRLHNPGKNHPAYRRFRPDGRLKYELFYEHGELQDPSPKVPAVRGYYADGSVHYEERYQTGKRQDGKDGTAAIRKWRNDGSLRHEMRYEDGRRADRPSRVAARA